LAFSENGCFAEFLENRSEIKIEFEILCVVGEGKGRGRGGSLSPYLRISVSPTHCNGEGLIFSV
jgi:hypothetical protein